MSDRSFVRIEREGGVAVVVIDRSEKLNALNVQVLAEISSAFDELSSDPSLRGVILTGAGEKAFVAGADISELATLGPAEGRALSRKGQSTFRAIERFRVPVLAAVGGYALGGGCELALACHLRIASDNARFGLPEVGLGLLPGYGGTVRLSRLVGLGRAVEMTLSGEMIDAATAERIGIVSRVVARADLMAEAHALMEKITKNGPVAVRLALESVYAAVDMSTEEALAHESALFGLLASTQDMTEGLTAFLEKRSAQFTGE